MPSIKLPTHDMNMNPSELVDYTFADMLDAAIEASQYASEISMDDATGKFVLNDGSLVSEFSARTDKYYGQLEERANDAREEFFEALESYMDERIELKLHKIFFPEPKKKKAVSSKPRAKKG